MSMKPALALKAGEVVEGDAFSKRHSDIRTVVIETFAKRPLLQKSHQHA